MSKRHCSRSEISSSRWMDFNQVEIQRRLNPSLRNPDLIQMVLDYLAPVRISVLRQSVRFFNRDEDGDHESWFLEQVVSLTGSSAHFTSMSSTSDDDSHWLHSSFDFDRDQKCFDLIQLTWLRPKEHRLGLWRFHFGSIQGISSLVLSSKWGIRDFIVPIPKWDPSNAEIAFDMDPLYPEQAWIAVWPHDAPEIFLAQVRKGDPTSVKWRLLRLDRDLKFHPDIWFYDSDHARSLCVHASSQRLFLLVQNSDSDDDDVDQLYMADIPLAAFQCDTWETIETVRGECQYGGTCDPEEEVEVNKEQAEKQDSSV